MILIFLGLLIGLFFAGFYFSVHALRWMVDYLLATFQVQIAIISPLEAILSIMQLTLLFMLIVSVPIILFFVILYVRPALYADERRMLMNAPVSLILGVLGSLFGFYLSINVFLPYFDGFAQILGVQNIWSMEKLSSFVIGNMFIFFLIFQTPLVIIFLHWLGWIKPNNMGYLRKAIIVVSLIIGAIVTPPDVASQLIVAVPFYLLFELSIQYCRIKDALANRKKLKQ